MLNRKQAPAIHPIDSVPALPTEVIPLTTDLDVHVLRSSLQPVLRLDVVFPAGRWFEGKEGLAHLSSKMILEGTARHTAAQIAELISFYGASITCQANADWATLTLYCLKKHFEPLLHLLQEILAEAALPEHEFSQLKTRTVQSIQVERKKNNYIATEAITAKVFGQTHPYKAGLLPETIDAVQLSEVRNFIRKYYQTNAAYIFLAGDVENQHLDLVKNLATGTGEQMEEMVHMQTPEPGISRISTASSLQASIQLGRLCPEPGSPEYFHLQILNEALGGYFGSRLMKNIREDKGYTYGIFSQIIPRKHATLWTIRTEVNGENADKAYQEISNEFEALKRHSIGKEEFTLVQNNLLGKFLTERATIFDQLEWQKFLVLNNLPAHFFDHYSEAITHTSIDTLQDLAKQYLVSTDWSAVIVGP